jgi:hypothetical protein
LYYKRFDLNNVKVIHFMVHLGGFLPTKPTVRTIDTINPINTNVSKDSLCKAAWGGSQIDKSEMGKYAMEILQPLELFHCANI